MTTTFPKQVSFLLALTAIALASTALSAQAEQAVPGTLSTSAAPLQTQSATTQTTEVAQTPTATEDTTVAQTVVAPGRTTQGGSSYIGVAGNIGISGNSGTGLGQSNFAVISKVGLTRNVSVRPAAIFGDNTTILVPVTYDFVSEQPLPIEQPSLQIAPYVGAGVSINTGGGDTVGFLATGGIDVPLTDQLTATGSVNASFQDRTDVGVLLGVGYNFRGF